MIRNSLYSQEFTSDELIFMWEAVRWQRVAAEDESPSYELEEYVLFCRYLEEKIHSMFIKTGDMG